MPTEAADGAVGVRPLTAGDKPFLREMLYLALHVPEGHPSFPRSILEEPAIARYVKDWGRDGDFGYVARVDGEDIGAAWLRFWKGQDRGYGFIDSEIPELSMAVEPEFRGRGIGSSLLGLVLEDAKLLAPGVSLSVSADNPALRLYRRFGFESVKEEGHSITMVLRWPDKKR
jgi:ribosomal protein S18 acetylase RimI-like enzyme